MGAQEEFENRDRAGVEKDLGPKRRSGGTEDILKLRWGLGKADTRSRLGV